MKNILIIICILALAGYILSVKAPQTWNSITSNISKSGWTQDLTKKAGEAWQKADQWLRAKNINIYDYKNRAEDFIKNFVGQNLSPK